MKNKPNTMPCPCGSNAMYAQCCGRYHAGTLPETAEQLMRSRYSAYVLHLMEYVHQTWHPRTRPELAELTGDDHTSTKWLGLEIKKHVADNENATVEFVARYKVGGRANRLHEISRFMREGGRWFYLDGSFPEG